MKIIAWIICGAICGYIAEKKGRNAIGWSIGGVAFGVFALIVLALLPSKKIEKSNVTNGYTTVPEDQIIDVNEIY